MERISIQDLALSVLPSKRGMKKKDAERFATTLFEVVKEGLASDRVVKIKGLGTGINFGKVNVKCCLRFFFYCP